MTPLHVLWLPVVLSAVLVFAVSSIIHMFTPWHRGDYTKVPNEDRVMEALRPFGLARGDYVMPRPATREEMTSPAFAEKRAKGPVMVFTVLRSGPLSMAPNLIQWLLYAVVVGVFAAYVAGRALPPGAPYRAVFRFVGVTAFLGYALALWQMSIWWGRAWATTIRATIDGLIYAFLTAAAFGWLWPH
ncbi:MAG TPA: hypothetical protein VM736_11160 [Gemmatimonadales bacterium]|nr:hypothetical protein [Gemmatimonadales bacterium]